jgi:hypothetical protein
MGHTFSASTNIPPHEFRGGVLKARPALLPARCSSYLLPAPERHPVENLATGDYPTHALARLLNSRAWREDLPLTIQMTEVTAV